MRAVGATPASTIRRARAKRARQRREGLIVLLLMLVLMMASTTAIYTVQSTQYEQRASSAVGETNWARGLAECTAMAGIAFAEGPGAQASNRPPIGVQWVAQGSNPAQYTQKYAIPEPTPPGGIGNESTSIQLMDAPARTTVAANNVPGGDLAVFLPPSGRGLASPDYPLFANYDSQTARVAGLRFYRAHWLQERLPVNQAGGNTNSNNNALGVARTRTVVTGFAEINVWEDPNDLSNVRGLHELDAISRGYIDTTP